MNAPYRVFLQSRKPLFRPMRYWWAVVSRQNGQTVLTSETYTTRARRDDSAQAFVLACGAAVSDVFDVTSGGVVLFDRTK